MTETYQMLCRNIEQNLAEQKRIILSIDGCSASGKSTLAFRLANDFSGAVVPVDDFFLPLTLRTPERLAEPGGNVHYERFLAQIVTPLLEIKKHNKAQPYWPELSWERYDCSAGTFSPAVKNTGKASLLIIEGAYSMRPEFRQIYDASVFLSVPAPVQRKRILARNGQARYEAFRDKWIPLENRYFSFYHVPECCQYQLDGTML